MSDQKYYPDYKEKKFASEEEFDKWLKENAVKKICFIADGQDCLFWWIDEGGEVLHSEMQASIWNGAIVNLSELQVDNQIGVMDSDNQQTTFYNFIVEDIVDLTAAKKVVIHK